MQASIILQGRSVLVVLARVSPIEARRARCRKERGTLPPRSLSLCRSVAISSALSLPRPTYAPEMLRCKTVDCHGAVFSLCTAMVAVGVPGTTEGRRPRPPHRALPRDYVYYTYSVRRARARARVRTCAYLHGIRWRT